MTLPEDEYALFDAVVSTTSSTVTEQHTDQDVVRTARTTRDGQVVSHTSYIPMEREAGKDVLGRESGHVVAPADRKQIVTSWQGMEDYDECPPDYGTWFAQYKSYTTHLVWTMGVAPREIDDVVAEIMTRFMERDALGVFDRGWATRSASGKSVFRSYYSKFVVTYARGKHRNNVRYVKRHNLLCDAPVGDDKGTTWLDRYVEDTAEVNGMPFYDSDYEALLSTLSQAVGADVVAVVTEMVEDGGKVSLTQLQARLGISARQAKVTRDKMRGALSSVIN